jgi:hypothetical protein
LYPTTGAVLERALLNHEVRINAAADAVAAAAIAAADAALAAGGGGAQAIAAAAAIHAAAAAPIASGLQPLPAETLEVAAAGRGVRQNFASPEAAAVFDGFQHPKKMGRGKLVPDS